MWANINHQTAMNLIVNLPRRLGMQRGNHVREERTRCVRSLDRCREILTKSAHSGNSGQALASHEQDATLRQSVQVNAAALVLLDNLMAVTTARPSAQLRGSGKRGMSKNENGGRGRLGIAIKAEQTTGVVSHGGLNNTREGGEGRKI